MRKAALAIFFVMAIVAAGFFVSKLLAAPHSWQPAVMNGTHQAQPDSDVVLPVNIEESGSWYCPMNPNYQPKYYWYDGPQVHREWWHW